MSLRPRSPTTLADSEMIQSVLDFPVTKRSRRPSADTLAQWPSALWPLAAEATIDNCHPHTRIHPSHLSTGNFRKIEKKVKIDFTGKYRMLTESLSESQSLSLPGNFSIFLKHFRKLNVCRIVFFQPA